MKTKQLKFYLSLLKDDELLLLKSEDSYFKSHYYQSPLNILTGFSGTEGDAIVDKNGKITLFVDTRYHILAEKQVFSNIEIYKRAFNESFYEALEKKYKKSTVLYVENNITLKKYLELDKHFDLRTYELKKSYLKNGDLNHKKPIFLVDKTIEKNDFKYKIEKLKRHNPKIKRMVVFNLDNISYLTNLRSFQMKFSSNFPSYLYLDFKNSNYILFVEKIPQNIEIEDLEFRKIGEFENFIKVIDDDIYINNSEITLKNYLLIRNPKNIKSNFLNLLSSIKPKSVIEDVKDISKRVDSAIFNFKNKIKEGMSEFELVELFENELTLAGSIAPSFKTILALDENSASIHYSSYDKNKFLKQESLFLLDCGGYSKSGYASDITRTFYFGKNPKPIYRQIYTAVLKAFISCFNSKQTCARDIDLIAREALKKYEKEGFYFNHGLGHGIGTSCHQNPPRLSNMTKDIIKPYQTHSIEPGLYGKYTKNKKIEFGVRIENCVYCDINYRRFSLSKFPFEEILIDYDMLNNSEKDFVGKWQADFVG